MKATTRVENDERPLETVEEKARAAFAKASIAWWKSAAGAVSRKSKRTARCRKYDWKIAE
jgi:hypothetical protein